MRELFTILVALSLPSEPILCPKGEVTLNHFQKVPTPDYEDREGYEVLSVLLNAKSREWKNEIVRIYSQTAVGQRIFDIEKDCSPTPREFREAFRDFNQKAKAKFAIQKRFTLEKEYEFDSSGLAYVGAPENAFRSGIYHLGAVGFDETRTRAVVFLEYRCGIQCGSSLFYLLKKTASGWQEAAARGSEAKACGRIY
ncbi:MAG: hypothetical protein NVS9B14_04360 [Candidatus Acidiferrum sp.]